MSPYIKLGIVMKLPQLATLQAGTITATRQFESAGNSPAAWQSVAENLLFASRVLSERCEVSEARSPVEATQLSNRARLGAVELMLKGMAMECLLKALWLEQGNLFVKADRFHAVSGAGSHDLPQIAQVVGLSPTALEVDLLRRLSHFIEYGGRYPIPKSSIKLRLTATPHGGKSVATTWSTPSDDRLFESLVLRITQLLH